jgi:adenylate cyclase
MERRLAAILAADVVGYSRLIEQDEAGTLAALKDRRKDILEPLVGAHRGRIVKVMGDGVLVEFASVVNAVACAVELQQRMAAANDGIAAERNIVLRIGINLGDVVVEGSDLYGDGVIIAVRLQAMAEPGGICLAASVQEQISNKLPLAFEDLGPCEAKNTSKPIRAFRVRTGHLEVARTVERQSKQSKPSIAVLPFTNMSGDPEQDYFSDGITEDIITDLSQVSALFVVARNTAFTFKGKAVEVVEAARKLNVGYILEGSVRKAGSRVRITVQLIDGATGGHLWAERYDRDFGDIFDLQDDISKSVVSALRVRLLPDELKSISARSTMNAEAYQCYLQGRSTYYLSWGNTPELRSARQLFAKAIAIDPGYARAYAGIADCDAFLWVHGDLDISYDQMLANSSKAIQLVPNLAEAHASKALALYLTGHSKEASSAFERTIELDPASFEAYFFYANCCREMGHFEKAATLFERAAELSRSDPISLCILADVYQALGRSKQCESTAHQAMVRIEAALSGRPDAAFTISFGAATLVFLGENARAEEFVNRAISLDAKSYIVRYNAGCTYAVIGKAGAALECLEYIFSHIPRVRRWLLGMIGHDTQFDSLRSRPDFKAFMKRLETDVGGVEGAE